MNVKAVIPLVAGLGIAGLAGKLGIDYVRKAGAAPKMVQLWTPTQDVPRGTAIDESYLQPLNFPASVAPKGALTDPKKIVGRVPHTGAPAGVPILDSMHLPAGTRAGIQVPEGLRAVAVKVDESSGVDNHLEPGDHVDVVGYFSTRRDNKNEIVARTIIENVEVAAVGARIAPEPPAPRVADDKNKPKSTANKEKAARAVTLLVKPDQIPTLHLAEQRGKIKLAMRGASDETTGNGETAKEADVTGIAEFVKDDDKDKDKSSLLGGLLSRFGAKHPPQNVPAIEPMPEPEPAPAHYDWVMVVMNGSEREVLGWQAGAQLQPVPVENDGPNIFQQSHKRADGKRSKPATRTGTPRANPPQGSDTPQNADEPTKPTEPPALPDDPPADDDPEHDQELFG